MRTASRRNLTVYLVAILNLLHSKHCSKETGTKSRQDYFGLSQDRAVLIDSANRRLILRHVQRCKHSHHILHA